MTSERFAEIMNSSNIECKLSELNDCNAFIGLQIIRKYLPKKGVEGASHDTIYSVSISQIVDAGITEEDAIRLRELNWMLDENQHGLACFV